jgi:hypothetical protein
MRSNFSLLVLILVSLVAVSAGMAASESGGSDAATGSHPAGNVTGWDIFVSGPSGAMGFLSGTSGFPTTAGAESPLVDKLLTGNREFRENVFAADPGL